METRNDRILKTAGLMDRFNASRTTVWRLSKQPGFPRRRVLGGSMRGYLESEINDYIANLPVEGEESGK